MTNAFNDLSIEIAYYVSLATLIKDAVTRDAIRDMIAELEAEKAALQPSRDAA